MTKINVLHLANNLSGKADGVYNHIKMITELTDKNAFKHFLCSSGNPTIINDLQNTRLTFINWKILNQSKFNFSFFSTLFRIIKKNDIDVIHCHSIKPYVIAGLINIFLRRKLIYNYHGAFISHKSYSRFDRFLYSTFHTIICTFRACSVCVVPYEVNKHKVLRDTSLFPKILAYNVCAIDKKRENPKNIESFFNSLSSETKKIASIGRLDENKNIKLGLRIFNELLSINKDYEYFIVGDGIILNELKEYVKKLQINSVFFVDYVENVQNYFSSFDAILITSYREGLPTVILEAMNEGLPFFSTNVGIAKFMAENENCGIIIDQSDIQSSAKIIHETIIDEVKMSQLISNGKNAMLKKYTKKSFAQFFNKLYIDNE